VTVSTINIAELLENEHMPPTIDIEIGRSTVGRNIFMHPLRSAAIID
jgi:hypothetical protein